MEISSIQIELIKSSLNIEGEIILTDLLENLIVILEFLLESRLKYLFFNRRNVV